MAFQSVPEAIEVQWRYTLYGVPMQNRIFVNVGATPTQNDCDTLTAQAWDAWNDNMKALAGTTLFLLSTYARDLENSPGFESTLFGSGSPLAGTLGEVIEDGQECINLRFDAGLTGRSTRGRVYLPGVASGDVASGQVNGTRGASYLVAFYDMVQDTIATIGTHVIVSRIADGVLRSLGVTYPVENYGFSSIIGSQNGRRVGT